MLGKIPELKNFVNNDNPDIIGITESWITKDTVDSFHTKEYKVLRRNWGGRRRGCVLYIKNNLEVMELEKMSGGRFEQIDSIWCIIALQGQDNLIVGVCYRSPNSAEEYNDLLNDQLRKVKKFNHSHLCIMGDFNHEAGRILRRLNFFDVTQDLYLYQHV